MLHPLEQWRKTQKPTRVTREQLGELLGVTAMEIYHYERGMRRIPAEKVDLISRTTGIAPHKLRPDIFLPREIEDATES